MALSLYEIECFLYAIHGNPAQDAMDYEFNARYDRYDGFGDPEHGGEGPYEPTAEQIAEWEAWQEKERRNTWDDGTDSTWDYLANLEDLSWYFYFSGEDPIPF